MKTLAAIISIVVVGSTVTVFAQQSSQWVPKGIGDCGGHDVECSAGPMPTNTMCHAGTIGLTAVCWDTRPRGWPSGYEAHCKPSAVWCTYKQINADQCAGSGEAGRKYECVAAGLQTPPARQQSSGARFDSICFNIRTNGGFIQKTGKEFMTSEQAKLIGKAICSYYSGQPGACNTYVDWGSWLIKNDLRKKEGGGDYKGVITASDGYEVCRAAFVSNDWSVTSRTTFNTVMVNDAGRNALGWYVSLPTGSNKGDWIDVRIAIEEVPKGTTQQNGCWQPNMNPWVCKGDACSTLHPQAKIGIPLTDEEKCIKH
jgi:hypothetical protein